MGLVIKAFFHGRGDPGLAEAGFARNQHDLAISPLGACPTAQQQVDLLVASNQPGQCRPAQRLEPARDGAWAQHLPGRHRRREALQRDRAEIAVFEEIADQPPRAGGDDDRVGFGKCLQASGEVRGLADDRLFLRRSFTDRIANHHLPGGDPDGGVEIGGSDVKAS